MKKYLTIIAAAMLAAACQNDDSTTADDIQKGEAIKFAVAEGGLTRAPGEIKNEALLAEKSFGVFAAYTGKLKYESTTVSSNYMYNQKVVGTQNNDGGYDWAYYPLKYWPNSVNEATGNYFDYVTFFAYAPYEAEPAEGTKTGIFDMSKNYDLGDPWINFRLPEDPWGETDGVSNQVDLMYGVKTAYITADGKYNDELFYNEQKPSENANPEEDNLRFVFRHALACIGDQITVRLGEEINEIAEDYAKIYATKLTIVYKNLTTKGRLVLNSPSGPNWKEVISGELTTERTYVKYLAALLLNSNDQELSVNEGLFYIPMRVRGCEPAIAEISLDYFVKLPGGKTYNGTATSTIDLDLTIIGEKQGIALIIGKDFNLMHLVYKLGTETATEPSWSRVTKK